jgi:response regulator of citrate/malate metabolism
MHCLVVEDQRILLDLLGTMVKSYSEINILSKAESIDSAKKKIRRIQHDRHRHS